MQWMLDWGRTVCLNSEALVLLFPTGCSSDDEAEHRRRSSVMVRASRLRG
jgi:hypothetical protein